MEYPFSDKVLLIFLFFIAAILTTTRGLYFFLKKPFYLKTLAKTFILLIIILIGYKGIMASLTTTELFDAHEKFYQTSAKGYIEKGFFSNFGLPDYYYGFYLEKITPEIKKIIDEIGYTGDLADSRSLTIAGKKYGYNGPVYTHTPPGAHLLVGVFTKFCGIGNVRCLRLSSATFSLLAFAFFAVMLWFSFSPLRAAILVSSVAVIPMTSYMMHTLHYFNYAFSLFLIQLGLLLYVFKKKIKFSKFNLTVLFFLGFIQGWISYEYFFLVCFSAFPLALFYYPLDQNEYKKQLFFAILCPLIGFLLAILLHFIQDALFFGSIYEAFTDFFDASAKRTNYLSWNNLVLNYFFVIPKKTRFFNLDFALLLWGVIQLIWLKDIRVTLKKPVIINIKWSSSGCNYLVILSALFISIAWIAIFPSVAVFHYSYQPRLLFFFYFVCILTILECFSVDHSITH